MTTPADTSSCPISATTSVPAKLNQLDKCMTDIDDAACDASYGQELVTAGKSGLVGWVQQFSKLVLNPIKTGLIIFKKLKATKFW